MRRFQSQKYLLIKKEKNKSEMNNYSWFYSGDSDLVGSLEIHFNSKI